MSPIFKGYAIQEFLESLTLEDGSDGLSRSVISNHLTLRTNTEDETLSFFRGGSLRSRREEMV